MINSGIPWIGEIPKEWSVCPLKTCIRWKSEKNHEDATVLSLYRDYGIVPKDSRDDNFNVTSLDTSGYKYVEVGDLVINKMKAWQGSIAVSDYEGIVSPAYHVCEITNERVYKRYLHYLLRNSSYLPEYMRLSTGLRIGQWDLGYDDFKNIKVILPKADEQQRIVSFLDAECNRIDKVIEQTKASIEEYKKLKQSIITQAVTKGIRPDREMKDSGIEWIGEIPKEWGIIPIKYICSYNDEVLQEDTTPDFIFDYIEIGSVEYGRGIISMQHIRFKEAPSRARRIVKENDIIVSTVRTYLKAVASIPHFNTPIIVSTGFVVIRPRDINHMFLKYVILSKAIVSEIESYSVGITYPAINASQVVKLKIPLPLIEEQNTIAIYLEEKCLKIDRIIESKEKLLADLESYKKSLIFVYTTGKKEVTM